MKAGLNNFLNRTDKLLKTAVGDGGAPSPTIFSIFSRFPLWGKWLGKRSETETIEVNNT